VTSLKFNGILTFGDVVESTESAIETAANRMPPFGTSLRSAVSRVLQSTLKVTADIQYNTETDDAIRVECRLAPHDERAKHTGTNTNSNAATPELTYTLIVYTYQPGGFILYQKKICGPATYGAMYPSKFGKLYVRLIASTVGLDGTSSQCQELFKVRKL
jgi:hypothetical protein